MRRVFPVGVSVDLLPMSHDLRAWIEARVAPTGLHAAQTRGGLQIFPFEPCDFGDLEWLELAVERTRAQPGGLVAAKQEAPYTRGMALASWGRQTGFGGAALDAARLAHHAARWKQLADEATAFLTATTPGAADTGPTAAPAGPGPAEERPGPAA